MQFTNEIRLPLPADEVFATLTDIERVASCLPGARVEGRDGDAHLGAMRVKVGPITADYGGRLTFEQLDHDERRAVLLARGEERTGQGLAEARIVSSVLEDGSGARVVVETDLTVRGRLAQFGSGPMEKIAKRMFADFAKNLEVLMTSGGHQGGATAAEADHSSTLDRSRLANGGSSDDGSGASPEPLNVVSVAGKPFAGLMLAFAAPVLIALAIGYLLGRRRS